MRFSVLFDTNVGTDDSINAGSEVPQVSALKPDLEKCSKEKSCEFKTFFSPSPLTTCEQKVIADGFSIVQVSWRFAREYLSVLCLVALFIPQVAAQQPEPVDFITVKQGPEEYQADEKLFDHLGSSVIRQIADVAYEVAVQKVLDPDAKLIARMTPYAFVAAEMQGAQLNIIATYRSKRSDRTTYQTNFVVNRADFPNPGGNGPLINDIVDTLRKASDNGERFRFIYHKRLSTSSYFLPSLFFRSERIFADTDGEPDSKKTTIRITTEQYSAPNKGPSSGALVREVAATPRTFAAVWDATRTSFSGAPEDKDVYFVQYPFTLPNDLLVATRNVDLDTLSAISSNLVFPISSESDVAQWVLWNDNESKDARTALSDLRHAATKQPTPVIVRVVDKTGQGDLEEAVKQAIRLSSTELVAWDEAYKQADVEWQLKKVHEGALLLTATYSDFLLDGEKPKQKFRISYLNNEDLTQRIGFLIHSRMHRIRPVWLYQDDTPTIIRDVAFEVSEGLTLPYQLIKWSNPERNDFTINQMSDVKAVKLDFSKFELSREPFPLRPTSTSSGTSGTKKLNFEPMGRADYRVLLLRPTEVRMLFKVLTVTLLLLFALALAGVIWELRRKDPRNEAG